MSLDEGNKIDFNMAQATLMRIDNIFKEIKEISIRTELPQNNPSFLRKGKGQHMKLKLTRDLFVQAVPLLSTGDVELLRNKMQGLKPLYKAMEVWNSGNKEKVNVALYNEGLEQSLDDFIIDLQIKLQKKGFFMPSGNGEKLS